jgi:hypothetical protein
MDFHRLKPVYSLRELLVEIGIVTVGILIALSLEALVETHRAHAWVVQASKNPRSELLLNRKILTTLLSIDKTAEAQLGALATYGEQRLAGNRPTRPNQDIHGDIDERSSASWDSTVATQALLHIPYDEADALARAYSGARSFNALEHESEPFWLAFEALPKDLEGLPDVELRDAVRQLQPLQSYIRVLMQGGQQLL